MKKFFVIFLLLIFAYICYAGAEGKSFLQSGIIIKINTDKKSYNQGEKVNITLIITNQGAKPVFFDFLSSKKYDFWVVDENNREIWRWSRDKFFLQVLTNMKLGAGKSHIFNEAWEQKNNKGNQLKPGIYKIYGEFSLKKLLPAGSVNIVIIK